MPCTLRALALYFLRLGALGFGGPIALTGAMQRDLVETRGWLSKQDYVEGLALAQLAPGPLAAQLAIYIGWVKARAWGAAVIGLAFVLPSFLIVLALAAAYVAGGGLSWMQGAFYGIGAAVIAIILRSVTKLVRLTMGRDALLWAIFAATGVVTAWTERELVSVIVGAGVVTWLVRTAPRWRVGRAGALVPAWLLAGLTGPASTGTIGTVFWFFLQAGAFVFGSGLAIVPFLYGGVVEHHHWLTERQFLDAVAVAMITPGPVVITVAFIGYLIAGLAGASVAAVATFLPCYLFTVLPAPYFKRFAAHPGLKAFVDGVTAAATGAIAGAAFVLGRRAIVDATTLAIAVATLLVLLSVRRLPEPVPIALAGLLGVALTR